MDNAMSRRVQCQKVKDNKNISDGFVSSNSVFKTRKKIDVMRAKSAAKGESYSY